MRYKTYSSNADKIVDFYYQNQRNTRAKISIDFSSGITLVKEKYYIFRKPHSPQPQSGKVFLFV